jgi:hypothetical protein
VVISSLIAWGIALWCIYAGSNLFRAVYHVKFNAQWISKPVYSDSTIMMMILFGFGFYFGAVLADIFVGLMIGLLLPDIKIKGISGAMKTMRLLSKGLFGTFSMKD